MHASVQFSSYLNISNTQLDENTVHFKFSGAVRLGLVHEGSIK